MRLLATNGSSNNQRIQKKNVPYGSNAAYINLSHTYEDTSMYNVF